MNLQVPELDTSDFERMVESARAMIQRYAPGWTDHNLHDPGMTLIDLLAFFVDQQVYRTGFVSDVHQRAFCALLGGHVRGPVPARGLIWPENQSLPKCFDVRASTPVKCLKQPEVPFALEYGLYLSDARLEEASFDSGRRRVAALALLQREKAPIAFTGSGKDTTGAFVLKFDRPIFQGARAQQPLSVGFEVAPTPGPAPYKAMPWSRLRFDYCIGDADWQQVRVVCDDTWGLLRSGSVRLEDPGVRGVGSSMLRLRLDLDAYPVPPSLLDAALNVLPIEQVEHGQDVQVDATGLPDQEIKFVSDDLVAPMPEVKGLYGQDAPWNEVTDFSRSGPNDLHFVRRADRLVFGNGVNGRCPPASSKIVIKACRRTLGARGGLRAGLSFEVPSLSLGHNVAFGTNRVALTGGKDRPTLQDLLVEARQAAFQRDLWLTNSELELAAKSLPGFAVARAQALPNFDRRLPKRALRGVRTLIVVPYRSGAASEQPKVPAGFVEAVRAALEPGRVMGERLYVAAPRYTRLHVAATLLAEPGVPFTQVEAEALERVAARLSDLERRPDIEPWPLGRTVSCGEIETLLAGTAGVSAVSACLIGRSPDALSQVDITLDPDELAVLQSAQLQVRALDARPGGDA